MTFCSFRTALQSKGSSCYNASSLSRRGPRRISARMLTREKQNTDQPLNLCGRSFSTTTTATASESTTSPQRQQRLIPTQHSSRGPPPVCRDPTELQELTQQILETPIGSLFCQNIKTKSTTTENDRDEAYAIAHESGELVEYLLRGYNRNISPLTLCGGVAGLDGGDVNPDEASVMLETMVDVIDRFHQEGEMYQRLRRETLNYKNAGSKSTEDSISSGSSSSSSSSNSDSDNNDDGLNEEIEIGKPVEDLFVSAVQDKLEVDARDKQLQDQKTLIGSKDDDFAIPGVTTNMYDTILDAMACASQFSLDASKDSYLQLLEPDDLYRVSLAAWKAHDLNNQHNNKSDSVDHYWFPSTVPTMITYNATLRGIGNLCLAENENNNEERRGIIVDQGLAYGFGVYNHLTHNKHGLPKRNAASIIYLLQTIKACIPPSRTRGNMTVALWHQASMEGLVTPKLIQVIHELHSDNCNGPEFDVFLQSLEECANSDQSNKIITPQRFARFAKKYSHSKFY
jgi:hypothetical protein